MLHGELHLKKPHIFLFIFSRFLTAPNARMYYVFWGTGVEHLRTLPIPLTKGSYQTILWKFLAIYSHSTRSKKHNIYSKCLVSFSGRFTVNLGLQ